MSGDHKQEDHTEHGSATRSLVRGLMLGLVLFVQLIVLSTFDVSISAVSGVGKEITTTFGTAVSELSPGYDTGTRLQVSLRLMQVAVLYFAVLVAVFRFMDSSSRFDAENDRLLFLVVLLALLSVSVSAFLAVVSSLKLFAETSFVGSLLFMGLGFLLSILAPTLALTSESRGREKISVDTPAGQRGPIKHEGEDTDNNGHTTQKHGQGHSVGLRREREE